MMGLFVDARVKGQTLFPGIWTAAVVAGEALIRKCMSGAAGITKCCVESRECSRAVRHKIPHQKKLLRLPGTRKAPDRICAPHHEAVHLPSLLKKSKDNKGTPISQIGKTNMVRGGTDSFQQVLKKKNLEQRGLADCSGICFVNRVRGPISGD
jgi:hypothetical protein